MGQEGSKGWGEQRAKPGWCRIKLVYFIQVPMLQDFIANIRNTCCYWYFQDGYTRCFQRYEEFTGGST